MFLSLTMVSFIQDSRVRHYGTLPAHDKHVLN